ncbi:MAG: sugar phosphate isomerase/epimerase family protein [Planctomycetota bacterium]
MFRLAYNTNGLSHHRILDALTLLSDLGYEGVAIAPDVACLDPFHPREGEVESVRKLAADLDLELAVETGARFLLDPRRKHRPTLLEESAADRARRADFLRRSIDLASDLGAGVVSMWSGASPNGVKADAADSEEDDDPRERERIWDRLCAEMPPLLHHARERGVRLAFEPEPGMFVERPAGFDELARRLGDQGDALGLCLDVGHLLVTGDVPVGDVIHRSASRLVHVHLDDIAGGVHEHRMFGEGDLDLSEVLEALVEIDYKGLAAVELSRDAHRGAQAAEEAMSHLRRALRA